MPSMLYRNKEWGTIFKILGHFCQHNNTSKYVSVNTIYMQNDRFLKELVRKYVSADLINDHSVLCHAILLWLQYTKSWGCGSVLECLPSYTKAPGLSHTSAKQKEVPGGWLAWRRVLEKGRFLRAHLDGFHRNASFWAADPPSCSLVCQ